jgi:hypothetical protein
MIRDVSRDRTAVGDPGRRPTRRGWWPRPVRPTPTPGDNQGTVEVRDVVLSGDTSHSGGMPNDGTATLSDCTIGGNTNYNFVDACGVRNIGSLTMVDSAISGNTGVWGLYSAGHGPATLDDCIVSDASNGSYAGRLWACEPGAGTLGVGDPAHGRYEAVAALPGFTRGLDFAGGLPFVGLSQVRESAVFSGMPITERLAMHERTCGVCAIDVSNGRVVALLRFESAVQEVFAVQVLPGPRYPRPGQRRRELARELDRPAR